MFYPKAFCLMSKVKENLTLKIQMLAEKVWDKGTKEFFEGIYKNLTSLIIRSSLSSPLYQYLKLKLLLRFFFLTAASAKKPSSLSNGDLTGNRRSELLWLKIPSPTHVTKLRLSARSEPFDGIYLAYTFEESKILWQCAHHTQNTLPSCSARGFWSSVIPLVPLHPHFG